MLISRSAGSFKVIFMLGPWWGPTNTIHHSVGIDEVLVIFKGGGDTLNYNTDFHNADV